MDPSAIIEILKKNNYDTTRSILCVLFTELHITAQSGPVLLYNTYIGPPSRGSMLLSRKLLIQSYRRDKEMMLSIVPL